MPPSEFPQLLAQYMRRIRASAAGVAAEIGLSREAVNNWRNGDALPGRKHRDRVLACARYLRLSEAETNRLLAAAAFEPEFPQELQRDAPAPVTSEQALPSPQVLQVLERLQATRPYPILMLLCPAHLGQPPEREAILAEAGRRYGAGRVLHLQPPYSLSAEAPEYFAAIAAQCGLEGVESDFAFEAALDARIKREGQLFCLVSRFEQGDPALRELLAGILRSLSEMHSGRLHLLICGGAALAELKYLGGDLSLLNIAHSERWPEPDAQALAQQRELAPALAGRALAASGGHPLLLEQALASLQQAPEQTLEALERELAASDLLWPALLPHLASADTRAALTRYLSEARLGPARPWLLDPQLRELYWANLLVERQAADGRWLEWRCEAVRRAGRAALAAAGA
jgi:transcriptional regulator with XRE-family HTH domain